MGDLSGQLSMQIMLDLLMLGGPSGDVSPPPQTSPSVTDKHRLNMEASIMDNPWV